MSFLYRVRRRARGKVPMTTDPRLVLLVERDAGFLETARAALVGQRIVTAGDLAEAVEIVAGGRVDLVLLGPAFSTDSQIAAASALATADPGVSLVLVAEITTNRTLRAALRAGFADVLDSPLDHASVSGLLTGVPRSSEPEITVTFVESGEATPPPPTDATEEPAPLPADPMPTEEGPPTTFEFEPAVSRVSDFEPGAPAVEEPDESPVVEVTGQSAGDPNISVPAEPDGTLAPTPWDDLPADADGAAGEPVEPELALERLIPQLPVQAPGDIVVPAARSERPRGSGRVIAVMTGKGGSGKTVVATNLAVAMGSRHNAESVVIVDGDFQFGDVALMLGIEPVRTIADIAGHTAEMSDAQIEAALIRHESGLRVLPAPLLPVRADEIGAKDLVAIVDRLRPLYETVVVDTGPVFDDGLVTVLEHADDVVAVVDMDLASVKNAKIVLDGLRAASFPMERVTLVVNRINSKARLDLGELERSLKLRVGGSVPSDRLVPQSVNDGVPAVLLSPRSRVARAFFALVESLDPEARGEQPTAS